MHFRPRYSLLTLLVLTALVAGGVKRWYGPHHVVEREDAYQETEYQYTRDWRSNKIIHGPHIFRHYDANGKLSRVSITYYRHGDLACYQKSSYGLSYIFDLSDPNILFTILEPTLEKGTLTTQEQQEYEAMIDTERHRLRKFHPDRKILGGYWPFR
jgi:hypothetical protein